MRRLATLAVLGMLGTALLVSGLHAQANPSLGVEGQVDKNRQLTKIGGVYVDANGDTVVVRGRFTIDGVQVTEATDPERDRDLDFGVTNLLAAAATDTGVATIRRSAAVDVRQYDPRKTNIIIHVQPAAADTAIGSAYWYDLAVAVYPLTSATLDLTGADLVTALTGVPYVPLKMSPEMLQLTETDLLAASAADSVGSYGVILTPNAANLGPGERRIRFSATRPVGPHLNPGVFQTVMLPLSFWLGNVSPRYLMVSVRHIQKATGATGSPSIRVDMEGLR